MKAKQRDENTPAWRCVNFTVTAPYNQSFEVGAVVRGDRPTRPDGGMSRDWVAANAAARDLEAADRNATSDSYDHDTAMRRHKALVSRPPFAGLRIVGYDNFGNPKWGHADVRKLPPQGDVPLFKYVADEWGFIGSAIRRKGETFRHDSPLSDSERNCMVPLNQAAQALYGPSEEVA